MYALATVLRVMYNCLHEYRVFTRKEKEDYDELEYQEDRKINPSIPMYYNKYEALALFVIRGAFKAVRYLIQEQFADILDTDIVLDEEDMEDEEQDGEQKAEQDGEQREEQDGEQREGEGVTASTTSTTSSSTPN